MESGRSDGCAASARAIAGLLGWSPSSIRIDVPHLPESLSLESIDFDLSRVGESPKANIFVRPQRPPTRVQRAANSGGAERAPHNIGDVGRQGSDRGNALERGLGARAPAG